LTSKYYKITSITKSQMVRGHPIEYDFLRDSWSKSKICSDLNYSLYSWSSKLCFENKKPKLKNSSLIDFTLGNLFIRYLDRLPLVILMKLRSLNEKSQTFGLLCFIFISIFE